jgi:hypothetical protein
MIAAARAMIQKPIRVGNHRLHAVISHFHVEVLGCGHSPQSYSDSSNSAILIRYTRTPSAVMSAK